MMSALLPSQKFIVVDGVTLKVHKDYFPEEYKGCDGCGAGWSEPLVPDTIYFKSIRSACCPHDFRYELGGRLEDKLEAEEEFLFNMLAIVEAHGKKRWIYPTKLARHRAIIYYGVVKDSDIAMKTFLANNEKKKDG